ncbi:MAG: type VI secretion system-associated protein TagF [bacterium]
MNQTESTIGYFGKLPNFADFVSFNSANDEINNFDQWLQKGLMIAKSRLVNKFDENYLAMPSYRFLFPSVNNSYSLIGTLYPGRDLSGRKFPFITYSRFINSNFYAGSFKFLPLLSRDLFLASDNFFNEAKNESASFELSETLNSIYFPSLSNNNECMDDYQNYLNETSINQFWIDSFPDGKDKYAVIKYLLELLTPLRNNYSSNFLPGVKLPFQYGLGSDTHNICVWIEIIAALIKDNSMKPFLFWTTANIDSYAYLYLYLNKPMPENFVSFIVHDNIVDSLCDLTALNKIEYNSDLPADYKSLLDEYQITIREFIERLD